MISLSTPTQNEMIEPAFAKTAWRTSTQAGADILVCQHEPDAVLAKLRKHVCQGLAEADLADNLQLQTA
jgi:hypothetical protein